VALRWRCKFRHRGSIPLPRFPNRLQNFRRFGVVFRWFLHFVCWMSAISLLPVCLTHWSRNYTTRVDPTSIIPTKFEADMTIHCWDIAFLSADTSRDLVTLTFHLLTSNSWRTWQVTWPTLPPRLKTLCLSVLELWVITFAYAFSVVSMDTIENAYADTAHAPNHVTRE